eukprot:scaffold98315_cov64-Phaeocystis_antarctica.AAC.4
MDNTAFNVCVQVQVWPWWHRLHCVYLSIYLSVSRLTPVCHPSGRLATLSCCRWRWSSCCRCPCCRSLSCCANRSATDPAAPRRGVCAPCPQPRATPELPGRCGTAPTFWELKAFCRGLATSRNGCKFAGAERAVEGA